jgi:hypothetical protein
MRLIFVHAVCATLKKQSAQISTSGDSTPERPGNASERAPKMTGAAATL